MSGRLCRGCTERSCGVAILELATAGVIGGTFAGVIASLGGWRGTQERPSF